MSVHYQIQSKDDNTDGKPVSGLVKITPEEALKSLEPTIEVLTPEEFEALGIEDAESHETVLTLTNSESNYVDVYTQYIVGSFYVPDKTSLDSDPDSFAFYLDDKRLIFVDMSDTAEGILETMAQSGVLRNVSTAHCLYVFFKHLTVDDLSYLGQVEDEMEMLEEKMLTENADVTINEIVSYRRLSMQFSSYYQQIGTMAAMLSDNENKMMSPEDAHSFDHEENLADRLIARAQTLKEYSVQLQELHQTRIEMKQNSIMQIFTIVTVLFAPLTLVTGWFGMNLSFIPGLDLTFMWALLIGIGIVSTASLLLLFYKKHWL